MAVLVSCPVCGKGASVAETQVGRTARCRQCGELIRLSPAGASAGPAVPDHSGSAQATGRARATAPAPADSVTEGGPSAAPDTPRQVGRFRVFGRLGAGAFGTVYRAHDPQLDREVALKVPQTGTLESPKAVERFLREARAAARLRHPHIVAVHDAGQDGPLYYIATEFIQGQTLARAIEAAPFDFRAAAHVVRKLGEALAYAHRLGIIHRDVKPANVMLDAAGEPHLMDFGLAYRHGTEEKLTQDGALLGTPAYMAPEQAAGQKGKAQPASDQYALGVVLYELICGRLPFAGPVSVVLYNVMNREPPAPRRLRPGVPKDLETICLKAMTKRPEQRYAGCGEFADDLRRWLDRQPIRARRVGPVERLARWCRRQPVAASAAGVAVACLLVVAAVLLVSGSKMAASALAAYSAEQKAKEAHEAEEQAKAEAAREQQAQSEAEAKADAAQKAREEAERWAEDQKRKAEEADKSKAKADQDHRTEAEASKKQAEEVTTRQQREAYLSYIHRAALEINGGNRNGGRQLLDKCKANLREWEWHLLSSRCDHEDILIQLPSTIYSIELSDHGDRLAAHCTNGTVKFVATDTGKSVRSYQWIASTVVLAPDGKQFAATSGGVVNIYDLNSGSIVRSLRGFPVTNIAYSPDGRRIVGRGIHGLRVWDGGTGNEIFTARGDYLFAFSPDGKRLAGIERQGPTTGAAADTYHGPNMSDSVRVWDATDGKEIGTMPHGVDCSVHRLYDLLFSPNGERLALNLWGGGAGSGESAVVWETSGWKETSRAWRWVDAFSPDGKRWVVGGYLRELPRDEQRYEQSRAILFPDKNLWNESEPAKQTQIVGSNTEPGDGHRRLYVPLFTPDGGRVVVPGSIALDKPVQAEKPSKTPFGGGEPMKLVKMSRYELQVRDAGSGDSIVSIPLPTEKSISKAVLSRDGRVLAILHGDKLITIWNAAAFAAKPQGDR
jgi:WD40 repeat protein